MNIKNVENRALMRKICFFEKCEKLPAKGDGTRGKCHVEVAHSNSPTTQHRCVINKSSHVYRVGHAFKKSLQIGPILLYFNPQLPPNFLGFDPSFRRILARRFNVEKPDERSNQSKLCSRSFRVFARKPIR